MLDALRQLHLFYMFCCNINFLDPVRGCFVHNSEQYCLGFLLLTINFITSYVFTSICVHFTEFIKFLALWHMKKVRHDTVGDTRKWI